MTYVKHSPLYVNKNMETDGSIWEEGSIIVQSINANITDVYLDRPLDYNIEYGRSDDEVERRDNYISATYSNDIYISVRTNCWAKIDVDIGIYSPDNVDHCGNYTRSIYKNFEPFDYEDSTSAILSKINLEGEIKIVPVCVNSSKKAYVQGQIGEVELEKQLEEAIDINS